MQRDLPAEFTNIAYPSGTQIHIISALFIHFSRWTKTKSEKLFSHEPCFGSLIPPDSCKHVYLHLYMHWDCIIEHYNSVPSRSGPSVYADTGNAFQMLPICFAPCSLLFNITIDRFLQWLSSFKFEFALSITLNCNQNVSPYDESFPSFPSIDHAQS